MSDRELVMLGTASQAPTRLRNQSAALLRWNGSGFLFDIGEGTQRQFARAGLSASLVDRICITHFHGDHCLGLPGMLMRLAMDDAGRVRPVHYPAAGEAFFRGFQAATAGQENVAVDAHPIVGPGVLHADAEITLRCARLAHSVETYGYRIEEPDRRRFVPERLAALGIEGAAVGRLRSAGSIVHDGRAVELDEVSEIRRGQVVAIIMDTAWCDGALELADGADLVLCESTFLSTDADLAARFAHMTARQAGRLAHEAGARRLVLTHFSRRYDDPEDFGREAREEFDDVVVAADLDRIPVPRRR